MGASVAFNLLIGGGEFDVVLTDRRPEMARSHVLDLEQVLEQGARGTVCEGTDDDIPQADILVVTAALPLTVNDSRMVYLEGNARIVTAVVDLCQKTGPACCCSSPTPSTHCARSCSGAPDSTAAGCSATRSTTRCVCERASVSPCGSAPGRVTAWSSVGGAAVTLERAQRAGRGLRRQWYVRHVALDSGRSSTWTSGLGVARMVSAIAHGNARPWTASLVLDGEYGISGVSLSVPVSLGPGGVAEIHEWELSAEQAAGFRKAADYVRDAAASAAVDVTGLAAGDDADR